MILNAEFKEQYQELNANFGVLTKGEKGDKGDKGDRGDTGASVITLNASGEIVSVSDVSPSEHNLGVKVASDTIADLTTVNVTRMGKNLIPPSTLAESGTASGLNYTNNGDGSITIDGTTTSTPYIYVYKSFYLPAGTYRLSQQGDDITPAYIYITGATGYKAVYNASSALVTSTGGTCSVVITAAANKTIENKTVKIMLEPGNVKTDYEAPKEPQTVTANADGTVEGLKSVSPNMTVFSDKGVIIDLAYNTDVKMYIDNKYEELRNAILSLGGDI